jgi:hypothetical protein
MSEANGNLQNPEPEDRGFLQRLSSVGPQGVIQTAGIIFTLAAAVAFFYGIFSLIASGTQPRVGASGPVDVWREIVIPYFGVILIVSIGLLCALFAVRLFSKAGSLTSQVIRPEDRSLLEPLISAPKKDAIGEYIRLASLSGFSGTFTKLGFTGLPLATVTLTLLLLAITLFLSDDELRKGVFDMAKLTLGAFLGSFVQRNIEQEKLVAGTATLPGQPIAPNPQASGTNPQAPVATRSQQTSTGSGPQAGGPGQGATQ